MTPAAGQLRPSAGIALLLLVAQAALVATAYVTTPRLAALAGLASFNCAVWAALRTFRLGLFAPACLYLYALGLFHFGMTSLWALGYPAHQLPDWFSAWPLGGPIALATLAIACYQAGLTLACARRASRTAVLPGPPRHNTPMYWCGLAVLAAGLGALLLGAWRIGFGRLAEASYFEAYTLTSTYDPRLFISSLQIAPMGLYLAVAAAPARHLRWTLALGMGWSAIVFLLGYRGLALAPLAVLLALAEQRGWKIPRARLAVGVILLLAAIPAARIARDKALGERSLTDLAVSASPLAAVAEMGGSIRPLVHSLVLLETEDLRWGYTYWQAVEMVIPNLNLEWQGGGYLPVEKLPPSRWVTRIVEPWLYERHGGLGFSAVAEPYMNFGAPGVVAYFLLLGWSLTRLGRPDASSPLRLAVWAMILGPLIWTARNSFTVFVRPAVWGVLLAWAAHRLSGAGRARRIQTAADPGRTTARRPLEELA